jgi:hypothetical protein
MKKLIIALLFVAATAFSTETNAQKITLFGSNTKSLDTLTNTTTEYLTSASNALNTTGLSGNYNIQVVLYSIASSSVTVTAVLESSIDGINYTRHFGNPGTNGMGCDTMAFGTLTTASTYTHIWSIPSTPFSYNTSSPAAPHAAVVRNSNSGRRLYFRVRLVPTGTGTTKYNGMLLAQN